MSDWYERRNELRSGMVFDTHDGTRVRLDRRVPGDGTQWYADVWNSHGNYWAAEDYTLEPGDLCGEPVVGGVS